ncbi:EAL domain-containing protein [Bacillus sp. MUM 13]|uniref:sensor domain-containing protein n=1 Tax=Bacillus sp. MUM 13 TaxID=1678001 RepID=UPI0008F57FB6|nr:EAL domain-containing protein [Bacillus sp. MUM 13]OIK09088.1 hypothetical protein BIV59_17805 [Bacillus sp. MUM 13]
MTANDSMPSDHLFDVYQSLFNYNPEAGYVLDMEGKFLLVNDSAVNLVGYSREEILSMSFVSILPKNQIDHTLQYFKSALKGNQERFYTSIQTKNKQYKELCVIALPIFNNSRITGVIGIAKDITEIKKTRLELIKSRSQMESIFNSVDICLWSFDLGMKRLLNISPACLKIFGLSQEKFIKNPILWREFIHPEDMGMVTRKQAALYEGTSLEYEYRIIHQDGTVKWISEHTIPMRDHIGRIVRFEGVVIDITQRKMAEEHLHHMAYHDTLTGLPNRRLLSERIESSLAKAKLKQEKVVFMYLDLDHFKFINDSLGHDLGDELLQVIAGRVKGCLRKQDTLSRQGGDEFAIILDDIDLKEAYEIADMCLSVISKPVLLRDQEFLLTASIGISLFPDHGQTAEHLIKRADQAMYQAKGNGRNNFKLYTEEMETGLTRRVLIGQSFHRALTNHEFSLHYQPIVNVEERRIVGFEALIRWQHPSLGFIPPSEFIELSEETGMILHIGAWVLQTACRQIKELELKGYSNLYVSVNVSARQFEEASFVKQLMDLLQENRLNPSQLKIEITESTAMTNVLDIIHKMNELRSIGVEISIDDFGTGYSSLSYLKSFHIHTLKIDQSFIADILLDSNQEAIVKAITAMAASLGIKTVAEGVEQLDQLIFLYSIGCTQMQGYFFSKPLPFAQAEKLLASGRDLFNGFPA